MANKLIEDLGASGALAGATLFETQVVGVTPTQKSTLSQLITLLNGSYLPLSGGTLTGNLLFTDNTLDIGASGATRPRTGYFGTSVVTPLVTILAAANANALTATGYSLTGANAQSMFDLAGTWNTSGTPSVFKINMTDTASNAASLFFDFQIAAASLATINKDGSFRATGAVTSGLAFERYAASPGSALTRTITDRALMFYIGIFIASDYELKWSSNMAGSGDCFAATDLILGRDAADVFAQRRTTNAQTFRWYRTFTDSTNYERGALQTAAGQVILAAETAGTGTDNIDLTLTAAGTGLVNVSTGMFRLGAAFTVATLPAAGTQGRIAYVTDSLAPAFLATVVGGGAIITTVFDNGTNWVAV